MCTKIFKYLITFMIITFVLSSPAVATWHSAGYLAITGILLHDDSLEITLQGNSGCNRIFRLSQSEPNYNVKASALLSAYYAGHDVNVDYTGDLNACDTPLHRFKVRR
jgi:hypothetical protein